MGQTNSSQSPYGGKSESKAGIYTGKNLHIADGSRTILDADLVEGTVLQEDPHHHEQPVEALKQRGAVYGTPTAGFITNFGIVVGSPSPGINELVSGSTTLRTGGKVSLATKGIALARVNGTCVAGVTRLAPGTDGVLVPTTPASVANTLDRVGATAPAYAVAMQANASGAALIEVSIIMPGD